MACRWSSLKYFMASCRTIRREPASPNSKGSKFPPGCWVDDDDRLNSQKDWSLARMNIRAAWAFAESRGRPVKGAGIVIAQPDTGVTNHQELSNIDRPAMFNLLESDRPLDATDPLTGFGNPGHGTGTASVVVSPETGDVTGSAPNARHIPIRAIESVVRLSQIKVAEAIDRAVDAGAHVITMSLGGIFSISLYRALLRAVEANVIVLAAAGNCVKLVVWPARFDDCIAVAGTNFDDAPWRGSSKGSDVDISAPAENVYRASVDAPSVGQGQGTSFAVALTAEGGGMLARIPWPQSGHRRSACARRNRAGYVPAASEGDGAPARGRLERA